jgi:hypothetical protein
MKIHDLIDENGRVFAFEVHNSLLGRRGAAKIVESIPGAKIVSGHKTLRKEDEFIEFVLDGVEFRVFEPFGDNSRYWIGPEPVRWCEQTAIVREAFEKHKKLGFLG